MAEERTPRENETRENDSYRPPDDWTPASILPSPTPQPGWVFRWVEQMFLDSQIIQMYPDLLEKDGNLVKLTTILS